ncbi:MAG TPA: geranylgeranyl reductase family protein [Saprospiraceae bacterium]|nr:geranylgeranyl reductase family protein [Saprospiraceae bacterium]
MLKTDVLVVGAGPGGAATALKLSYLNIPCILLDKSYFPRDKVCGDAISGKVTTLLRRLDLKMLERLRAKTTHCDVWGVRFVAPNYSIVDIPFSPHYEREPEKAPGYVMRRMDFDNFLIDEVRNQADIQFFEGTEAIHFQRTEHGYQVKTKDDREISCKLLIVATGAYSAFSRKQAGLKKEDKHYAAAVRAYYTNVTGFSKDNFIELQFLKDYVPGYFWMFPLPNGGANVGLGMRSDFVSKRKVNLRVELERIIREHPEIAPRFAKAEREGKIEGYGLPLGSKQRSISGDHYLLVGDAGALIDPLTGEGIGNAFYSGFIAAEQARDCLLANDFSAATLRAYDKRVERVLGSEMKLSYRMQELARYPWLLNIIGRIILGNQKMLFVFSRMYTDFNIREQVVKPWFWLKMLFSKAKDRAPQNE